VREPGGFSFAQSQTFIQAALNLVLNLVMPCYDAPIDHGGVMNVMHNIQPISFLKTNTSDVVRQVQETREPVLITVNGKVQAVIQDPLSYQKMQDQLTMLRMLAHGQKQIEQGKVSDHDDLFARLEAEDGES
jgi:prevent-host-death family protein